MTISLYPHQTLARDNVMAGWNGGKSAQLAVIPTGGGKTEIGLGTLKAELAGGTMTRALWLAHTDVLVKQPPARIARHWPSLTDCGIVQGKVNESQHMLTFGTRQTLAMPQRMKEVLKYGEISHLVIDEAHHAPSKQYQDIIEALKAVNPDLRVLGITATPTRSDGQGMVTVFDEVALALDLMDLIPQYLVPPIGKAIQTGIHLANAKSYVNEYGDRVFSRKSVSNVFETDNCFELVVESHREFGEERKGIAFTATIDSAHRLAKLFNKAGISAVAIDGTIKGTEREAIITDTRAGRYEVLVNCQVLTEGFDWPAASVVHIVKRTRSVGPYLQMMGRGLRLWPGKADCLILDYVGVEHNLSIGLEDVLGNRKKSQRADVERGEVVAAVQFEQGEMAWAMGDADQLQARTIKFFAESRWSWYRHPDGWASIGLGAGKVDKISRALLLSPPDDNQEFQLYFTWKRHNDKHWHAAEGIQGSFEAVQSSADDKCQRFGDRTLADKNKAWRLRPVSAGQAKWFERRGMTTAGMNRGTASDAITHLISYTAYKEALRL